MSLQANLESFRADFYRRVPDDVRQAMERADLDLLASGITERALQAGMSAPAFALPGVDGTVARLADLLARGPVVVSFYRGGWCPYCNLELRALQAALPAIRAHGATLVAISPERPDASLSTAEKNALTFPVLSDRNSAVAESFGIAFDLAEELRPLYTRFGHPLPERNGDERWRLPIPATYVIDRDGTIAYAFIDTDYRRRLEPAEVVAVLGRLGGRSAGSTAGAPA